MFQEHDLKKAERRLKEECADRAHSDKEQKARQEKTADLQKEIKRLRRTVHTLQRHMLVSISTPGYLTQYRLNVTLLHWNSHNICINVSHTSLFFVDQEWAGRLLITCRGGALCAGRGGVCGEDPAEAQSGAQRGWQAAARGWDGAQRHSSQGLTQCWGVTLLTSLHFSVPRQKHNC